MKMTRRAWMAVAFAAALSSGWMTVGEAVLHAATCTGADPCKACSNCRYCKRCAKDGKTCGTCKKLAEHQ